MTKEKEAEAAKPPSRRKVDAPAPTRAVSESDAPVARHDEVGNAGVLKLLSADKPPATDSVDAAPLIPVQFDAREPWRIVMPPGKTMDVLAMSLYGTMTVPLDISISWYDYQPRLTIDPALLRAPYRAQYDAAMGALKSRLDAECWADYQELKERIQFYVFARSARPIEIGAHHLHHFRCECAPCPVQRHLSAAYEGLGA